MVSIILFLVALLGVGGFAFVLSNYRRQRDWEEGPGKVPEDYS